MSAKTKSSKPIGISEKAPVYDLETLELYYTEFEFGDYLRNIRRSKNISIRQLAKAVGKTATYISDIERGNNNPPGKELLEKIIEALYIKNYPTLKYNLYDLAAIKKNDIPADVKSYIKNQKQILYVIRKISEKSDSEKIWSELEKAIV